MAGDPRPPVEVPLPPGYTVVEKLGAGGFATVWLAEQGQLGRRVAVKLLGETLEDDERERRFLAECRAVGRLSGHPAVVTVHDAGTTADGRPYLVMEHLPGGSLHDRLRAGGPLSWAEVADIGVHVADALSAAHDTGILHRDVKPANVLLDETGAPKLADFGIARLAEGTATATGHVLGTILYTPPEVLSGLRPAPTADVWALGAMLHALLTGRSPFQGNEDEPPAASIARVLRSEPPALPTDLPRDLTELIDAMLAADPEDRPQSAAEVARRLQAVQRAHGLPVTAARSTRDVVDAVGPGADATQVGFAPISADLTDRSESPSAPPPSPTVVVPPPRQSAASGPTPAPPDAAEAPTTPVAPAAEAQRGPTSPDGAAPPSTPAATAVVGSTLPVGAQGAGARGAGVQAGGPPGAGPSAGAVPAGPAPGAPPPSAPPPPRRRRGLVVAAVIAAVVLVAVVAAAALTLGGGDDGDDTAGTDGPGSEPATSGGGSGSPAPASVETIWGVPTAVPSGTTEAPAPVEGGPGAVDCGATFQCGAATVDGEAVVAYPDEEGTLSVDRLTADGTATWSVTVDTVPANVSVVVAGGSVLVVTAEDDPDSDDPAEEVRAYRALDSSSGAPLWGPITYDDDIRTLRPTDQASADVSVLSATGPDGPQVIAFDNAEGTELWVQPGRMLAADAERVYTAGPGIVARDITTGEEVWSSDVGVVDDGGSPVGRLGVVLDGVLVTVSGADVVGLDATSGSQAWAPQPLSEGGAQLDVPLALSAASGRAVVVAQTGDLGIDPATGSVAWREVRAPLLAQDADNIWVGTEDRLVVGQLGGRLRLLATGEAGEELASVEVGPLEPSRSSFAFAGGIAVLTDDGITAYSTEDLSELWSDTGVAGARTLVTTDGGVVLLGPTGVTTLRG